MEEASLPAEPSISPNDSLPHFQAESCSASPGSLENQIRPHDHHLAHLQYQVLEVQSALPSLGSLGKEESRKEAVAASSLYEDPLLVDDHLVQCQDLLANTVSPSLDLEVEIASPSLRSLDNQAATRKEDDTASSFSEGCDHSSSAALPVKDYVIHSQCHDLEIESSLPSVMVRDQAKARKEESYRNVSPYSTWPVDDHPLDLQRYDSEGKSASLSLESAEDQAVERKEGYHMPYLPCSNSPHSSLFAWSEQQQESSLSGSSSLNADTQELIKTNSPPILPPLLLPPSNLSHVILPLSSSNGELMPTSVPVCMGPTGLLHSEMQNPSLSEPSAEHPSIGADGATVSNIDHAAAFASNSKHVLTEELRAKVVKQVEFYFSDANLPTDHHLLKFVRKDPEGFVPIPVIASFRKVRMLVKNHALVATALRSSTQLVVSDDGKKVRRLEPLTEIHFEEVQSRTVVAENLPEDHSLPAMEKLFGTIGNVKMIRICKPEESSGTSQTASKFHKADILISNKVHALVEYESVEVAEKAVAELTDKRNWRSGLHVRLLLRRTFQNKHGHQKPSGMKERRYFASSDAGDKSGGEDDIHLLADEASEKIEEQVVHGADKMEDALGNEKDGIRRGRGWGRGRGRGRGHHQANGGRGHGLGTSPYSNYSGSVEKKPPPVPRMPDGTRGFTMGRGKNLASTSV